MTEKQLLKKLDIPDWRHLSKDKIAVFANDFYKLDPEVAKAILAQFPKFSETSLELVNQLQTIFKESSSSVKDIDSQTLQNIQCTIERLQSDLPNASNELKAKYIDAIVELVKQEREISESHKKFHLESLKTICQTIGIIAVGLGAGLGVITSLRSNDMTLDKPEDQKSDDSDDFIDIDNITL